MAEFGEKMADEDYFGAHVTVLDDAGRIVVPRRFRDIMDGQDHVTWFITPGLNGNLYLYTREQWARVLEENQPAYKLRDQATHQYFSFGYGFTHETRVDRQGRMVIPPVLRDLLGLERDVVLVGAQHRLELWSRDAWDAFWRQMWPQYGKKATELAAAASGGAAQTAV